MLSGILSTAFTNRAMCVCRSTEQDAYTTLINMIRTKLSKAETKRKGTLLKLSRQTYFSCCLNTDSECKLKWILHYN